MRWLHALVVVASVGATVWGGSPAGADGGAFIELDKTYYLPGETAVGTSYVLIPKAKQDILDRGPFYAFAVRGSAWIREGRPIPESAVELGVLTVRSRPHDTKLGLSFMMPELPDGNYTVQVCNDPCTISGFRDPLDGFFSIVHTARERRLLIKQQDLRGQIWHVRRTLRRAQRGSVASVHDLVEMRKLRDALVAENDRLRTEVSAVPAKSEQARPWVDRWAGLAIGLGLIMVAVAVARRRRRPPLAVATSLPTGSGERERREPASVP